METFPVSKKWEICPVIAVYLDLPASEARVLGVVLPWWDVQVTVVAELHVFDRHLDPCCTLHHLQLHR